MKISPIFTNFFLFHCVAYCTVSVCFPNRSDYALPTMAQSAMRALCMQPHRPFRFFDKLYFHPTIPSNRVLATNVVPCFDAFLVHVLSLNHVPVIFSWNCCSLVLVSACVCARAQDFCADHKSRLGALETHREVARAVTAAHATLQKAQTALTDAMQVCACVVRVILFLGMNCFCLVCLCEINARLCVVFSVSMSRRVVLVFPSTNLESIFSSRFQLGMLPRLALLSSARTNECTFSLFGCTRTHALRPTGADRPSSNPCSRR
jgi:hypothetical protein